MVASDVAEIIRFGAEIGLSLNISKCEDKAQVEASLVSAYHRASFSAASCQHSGDWLFALPIASCGLKLEKRGGQSCSRVEVGPRSLHSTSVLMRITSGRSWASQFCLQKSPGQVGKASRPQRLGRSMLCLSRNPRDKRANRVVPRRRKEARWSNTRLMAERQVFMLGRDGHMPSGRSIRNWVHPRSRCCSGTRLFSQRGKICQHWKRIPLCAYRGRNLRPNEHVGMPTLCQSWKKDLLGVRR